MGGKSVIKSIFHPIQGHFLSSISQNSLNLIYKIVLILFIKQSLSALKHQLLSFPLSEAFLLIRQSFSMQYKDSYFHTVLKHNVPSGISHTVARFSWSFQGRQQVWHGQFQDNHLQSSVLLHQEVLTQVLAIVMGYTQPCFVLSEDILGHLQHHPPSAGISTGTPPTHWLYCCVGTPFTNNCSINFSN